MADPAGREATPPERVRCLGFCRRCSRPIEHHGDKWRDVQGFALCGMGVYDHEPKPGSVTTVVVRGEPWRAGRRQHQQEAT